MSKAMASRARMALELQRDLLGLVPQPPSAA